jgi:hypothetical protein
LEGVLGWAQHLVIAQKQKPEVADLLISSRLPVIDLVGALPASRKLAAHTL